MLVVMNNTATEKDIKRVAMFLESKGFEARVSYGEARVVVHAIGVIEDVDQRDFELLPNVLEVIKDNLSIGIDPEKTTIFVQSQIPELTEQIQYLRILLSM